MRSMLHSTGNIHTPLPALHILSRWVVGPLPLDGAPKAVIRTHALIRQAKVSPLPYPPGGRSSTGNAMPPYRGVKALVTLFATLATQVGQA